jgi:hypothetical protein
MKSRFITIGTVVASIALSQALASAEDATKPGASHLQSTTSGQQVSGLEGKIMTLHAYLSGVSGKGAANAGSAATSPSSTPSSAQRDRSQVTDTSDDRARTRAERERAEQERANVNPNDPARRSPTDTTRPTETTRPDASNPAWQGWAGTGASSFADQPMVFVAMRGTTGISSSSTTSASSTSTSTSTERNPNAPITTPPPVTPPPASFATSTQGEAYVLLCNHNDATSRNAFSKVQSLGSSTSDRVQVSGKDETDATRRSDDPTRQPATDRSTTQDYKPYAPKYGQGVLEGKLVKVSGKILSRGGIQAIEVTSIDDVSAPSTSPSSPSKEGTSIK